MFNTVYEGEDLSFLVTDLEPNLSYTFRVCSRFGNEGRWSSWSIPRNGITSLDPHGMFNALLCLEGFFCLCFFFANFVCGV